MPPSKIDTAHGVAQISNDVAQKLRFAVCLAAFNGMKWLPEQVNTILQQIDVCVTLFISVDQSTDGTEKWVDELAASDSRVQSLPHGNHFGGAAKNFFRLIREVDFSCFDYMSFADQDDIWAPDKLTRAHCTLVRTGADAYSSNVLAFWPSGQSRLIEKSQPQRQWDFLFEAAGPGCTYVMSRKLVLAIQNAVNTHWIDVNRVELHDWFVYAFSRANGYNWIIDEYPGLRYRQHANNQVGVNLGWAAHVHRTKKILSGWGLYQAALIAGLVGLGAHPFVVRWGRGGGRTGLLSLALQASQCRRRVRDQVLFGISCLILAVVRKP